MNGKIWVLGDAVVDLLPDGEGRLLQCPGVADYSALTVDGGMSAITINAEDAAVVGTVAIS